MGHWATFSIGPLRLGRGPEGLREPWSCPKVVGDLWLVPTSRASVSPSVFNRLDPSGSDNLVMPQTLMAEGETSPSQMPTTPWVPSQSGGLVQHLLPVLHPESWWQPLYIRAQKVRAYWPSLAIAMAVVTRSHVLGQGRPHGLVSRSTLPPKTPLTSLSVGLSPSASVCWVWVCFKDFKSSLHPAWGLNL